MIATSLALALGVSVASANPLTCTSTPQTSTPIFCYNNNGGTSGTVSNLNSVNWNGTNGGGDGTFWTLIHNQAPVNITLQFNSNGNGSGSLSGDTYTVALDGNVKGNGKNTKILQLSSNGKGIDMQEKLLTFDFGTQAPSNSDWGENNQSKYRKMILDLSNVGSSPQALKGNIEVIAGRAQGYYGENKFEAIFGKDVIGNITIKNTSNDSYNDISTTMTFNDNAKIQGNLSLSATNTNNTNTITGLGGITGNVSIAAGTNNITFSDSADASIQGSITISGGTNTFTFGKTGGATYSGNATITGGVTTFLGLSSFTATNKNLINIDKGQNVTVNFGDTRTKVENFNANFDIRTTDKGAKITLNFHNTNNTLTGNIYSSEGFNYGRPETAVTFYGSGENKIIGDITARGSYYGSTPYVTNTINFESGNATIQGTLKGERSDYTNFGTNKVNFKSGSVNALIQGDIIAGAGFNTIKFENSGTKKIIGNITGASSASGGAGVNTIDFMGNNAEIEGEIKAELGNNTITFSQGGSISSTVKAIGRGDSSYAHNFNTITGVSNIGGEVSAGGVAKNDITFHTSGDNQFINGGVSAASSSSGGAGKNIITFKTANAQIKGGVSANLGNNTITFDNGGSIQNGVSVIGTGASSSSDNFNRITGVTTIGGDILSSANGQNTIEFHTSGVQSIGGNISTGTSESGGAGSNTIIFKGSSATIKGNILSSYGSNTISASGEANIQGNIQSTGSSNKLTLNGTTNTLGTSHTNTILANGGTNQITATALTINSSIIAGGNTAISSNANGGDSGAQGKNLIELSGASAFGNNIIIRAGNRNNTNTEKSNIIKFAGNVSGSIAELTAVSTGGTLTNTKNVLSFDGLSSPTTLTIADINKSDSIGNFSTGYNYIGKGLTTGSANNGSLTLSSSFNDNNWGESTYQADKLTLNVTGSIYAKNGKNYINVGAISVGTDIDGNGGTNNIATANGFQAGAITARWGGVNNIIVGGDATISGNVTAGGNDKNNGTNNLTFNKTSGIHNITGNLIANNGNNILNFAGTTSNTFSMTEASSKLSVGGSGNNTFNIQENTKITSDLTAERTGGSGKNIFKISNSKSLTFADTSSTAKTLTTTSGETEIVFLGDSSSSTGTFAGNVTTSDGSTTFSFSNDNGTYRITGTLSTSAEGKNIIDLSSKSATISNDLTFSGSDVTGEGGNIINIGDGKTLTLQDTTRQIKAINTTNGITYINFNGSSGTLTGNVSTTGGSTTFNLGALDSASVTAIISSGNTITNSSGATNTFNINAKSTTLQYGANGLAFSTGTNNINFENTSGATLNWKNADGTTQAISTTGGSTNINFNHNGTIDGSISTTGGGATNINVAGTSNAVITGGVTASTLNFTGSAGRIILRGESNTLSSVSFDKGDHILSLSDGFTSGGGEKRETRRKLVIDTLSNTGKGSITFGTQTTATEADTFVIKGGSKNQGTYHFGIIVENGVNLEDIGAEKAVRLASVAQSAGITFESTSKVISGFTQAQADITNTFTNENGETGAGYTSYYIGKVSNAEVIVAEQEITATAFTLNYDLYMANFNSLNKRMGELRENAHSQGVWARVFNGAQTNDFGLGSKSNYTTIQAGYDYAFGFEGANNYLGVALSYALSTSTSNNKAFDSLGQQREIGNIYSNAVEVAIYNSYVSDMGWYNDSIAKFSYLMSSFDIDNLNTGSSTKNNTNNFALTFGDEVGYVFKLGESKEWSITPQVELTFGYFNQSDFKQTLANSMAYLASSADAVLTLRSRVGSSFAYDFKNFTQDKGINASVYVGAFYEYDYVSGGSITMSTDQMSGVENILSDISSDGRVVMNVGTNMTIKDNTRIYFDFEKSFVGKITTDYQVNMGVRYSFGESNGYTPMIEKAEFKAPLKVEGESEEEVEEEASKESEANTTEQSNANESKIDEKTQSQDSKEQNAENKAEEKKDAKEESKEGKEVSKAK